MKNATIDQFTHHKDTLPEQTISLAKKILSKMNIITEELFLKESSIGTYALRLVIKNTDIGTNGKGINELYAKASAYGEFLERLQNNAFNPFLDFHTELGFKYYFDEKVFTSKQLLANESSFISNIIKILFTNPTINNDIEQEFNLLFNDSTILQNDDVNYTCIPFYNIREEAIEDLPYNIIFPYYGTNGMCAGNTFEEAIIQGLSEIFERYSIREIINKKLTPPSISENFLLQYPGIYKMYNNIKVTGKYTIILKDCSLDGLFPVVALIIINKNTGKYGINFGSHPDIHIALERVFTESTQGQDIDYFTKRANIKFLNSGAANPFNISNIYTTGKGDYPYSLFQNNPSYSFSLNNFTSKLTNKEYLKYWINNLHKLGFNILIRNNSYTAFPAFHVIIPGLSELEYPDKSTIYQHQLIKKIHKYIANPSLIKDDNVITVIKTLLLFSTTYGQNSLSNYHKRNDEFRYPMEEYRLDILYFVMILFSFKGDYSNSLKISYKMLSTGKLKNPDYTWVFLCSKFFEGMLNLIEFDIVIDTLSKFFDKYLVKRLKSTFSVPSQIITSIYPDDSNNYIFRNIQYKVFYEYKKYEKTVSIDQKLIKNYFIELNN